METLLLRQRRPIQKRHAVVPVRKGVGKVRKGGDGILGSGRARNRPPQKLLLGQRDGRLPCDEVQLHRFAEAALHAQHRPSVVVRGAHLENLLEDLESRPHPHRRALHAIEEHGLGVEQVACGACVAGVRQHSADVVPGIRKQLRLALRRVVHRRLREPPRRHRLSVDQLDPPVLGQVHAPEFVERRRVRRVGVDQTQQKVHVPHGCHVDGAALHKADVGQRLAVVQYVAAVRRQLIAHACPRTRHTVLDLLEQRAVLACREGKCVDDFRTQLPHSVLRLHVLEGLCFTAIDVDVEQHCRASKKGGGGQRRGCLTKGR
eukprot:Rhum_TRINITY_DN18645_c0_g1::Rhum_TRINITY_DN18645_c0_g1_i1::g.167868::m.167868